MKAAITCVAGYVPEDILTNDDLSKMVDTNDEWIKTRTGISQRHILKDPTKATSDMGAEAVKTLCEKRGIDPTEIDVLITATVTPDMLFPSTSNLIVTLLIIFLMHVILWVIWLTMMSGEPYQMCQMKKS